MVRGRAFLVISVLGIWVFSACHPLALREWPVVSAGAGLPNPMVIHASRQEILWSRLVDVVDDYFRTGDVLVEGRIETFPLTGASVLEPWRKDSIGASNRWESTFQTIRRIAHVRVIPTAGGYLVGVQVEKQLEDLQRPQHARATTETIENKESLDRLEEGLSQPPRTLGWIGLGRDVALEQRILRDLRAQFGP